jgi:predicted HicB family RNase H-like nuclease
MEALVMTSTLKYKGYTGRVVFDAEDNILFGEVIGLKDIIVFQGTTVEEIVHAFHESVDSYLRFCEEHNQRPEKPFSGNIPFRTTPENHYRIYMAAKLADKSISAWMREVLAAAAQQAIAAAEEGEVVLPSVTEPSAERLANLIRETSSYGFSSGTGQEDKEEVPAAPSWSNVMPVRLINPETIGQLVAEEATQKVAQEETPVSGKKLHDLVLGAVHTALDSSIPGFTMGNAVFGLLSSYTAGPANVESKEAEKGRRRIRKLPDTDELTSPQNVANTGNKRKTQGSSVVRRKPR